MDGYGLNITTGNMAPWVNSTTYYFGNYPSTPSTSANARRLYIPRNGVITTCVIFSNSSTTAGSGEPWPIVIRLNDTTDYTFDSESVAGSLRVFKNYALNIPVVAGDYIEFKTTTPAWATPPSSGNSTGSLYVRTPS